MIVFVQKQWAGYKPGDQADISDPAVLKKGIECGLFSESAKEQKTPAAGSGEQVIDKQKKSKK